MMTAPARHRKRPVEVETFQYTPPSHDDPAQAGNAGHIADWADGGTGSVVRPTQYWGHVGHPQCWDLYVTTPEDGEESGAQVEHVASPGDWIIKGVAGEFYPCKPEIFRETYDPVVS